VRTLPEVFLNELNRFLKSENGKISVVVMPDFFLDRILCLNWNTKTLSEKLENVARRKGGSIDGLKQAELRGGNAINTASADSMHRHGRTATHQTLPEVKQR